MNSRPRRPVWPLLLLALLSCALLGPSGYSLAAGHPAARATHRVVRALPRKHAVTHKTPCRTVVRKVTCRTCKGGKKTIKQSICPHPKKKAPAIRCHTVVRKVACRTCKGGKKTVKQTVCPARPKKAGGHAVHTTGPSKRAAVMPTAIQYPTPLPYATATSTRVAGSTSGSSGGESQPATIPIVKPTSRATVVVTALAAATAVATIPPVRLPGAKPTPAPTVPPVSIGAFVDSLRVMNYFPARNSWRLMWQNWDPGVLDVDFGRIAAMHANTVRLCLDTYEIGYPIPQQTMLQHIDQFISIAASHGLKVHLTLFEQWTAYTDIAGSKQWANAIVGRYAGDPRIAFIDLQNELDINGASNPAAYSWARVMVPYIKSIDGGIPVTVSFSGKDDASGFARFLDGLAGAPLDFYDYHFYDTWAPQEAYAVLGQAKAMVAPAPLFIGETGVSTCACNTAVPEGLPATESAMEAFQDHDYRLVATAAVALHLPPPAPWVYSDFAPGTMTQPGPGGIGYHYGLFHLDGTQKPIVSSVSRAFGTDSVDPWFNNGFEDAVDGGNGTTLPAKWMLWQANNAQFARDTTVAHTGNASVRISGSTPAPYGIPAFYISPVAAIMPGHTYSANVWARGLNATGTTRITIAWFDAGNHWLSQTSSSPLPTGTTTWQALSVSGVAPTNAASAEIHLQSDRNSGTAWFDDVSFSGS